MGCGECDSITKSTTSGALIADTSAIFREAKALFERVNVPCVELRGVGIQLTKLEKCPPVNSALSNFLKHPPTTKNGGKEDAVNSKAERQKSKSESEPKVLERNVQKSVGGVAEKTAASSNRGKSGKGRGRGERKNNKFNSNNIGRYFRSENNTNVVRSK